MKIYFIYAYFQDLSSWSQVYSFYFFFFLSKKCFWYFLQHLIFLYYIYIHQFIYFVLIKFFSTFFYCRSSLTISFYFFVRYHCFFFHKADIIYFNKKLCYRMKGIGGSNTRIIQYNILSQFACLIRSPISIFSFRS